MSNKIREREIQIKKLQIYLYQEDCRWTVEVLGDRLVLLSKTSILKIRKRNELTTHRTAQSLIEISNNKENSASKVTLLDCEDEMDEADYSKVQDLSNCCRDAQWDINR